MDKLQFLVLILFISDTIYEMSRISFIFIHNIQCVGCGSRGLWDGMDGTEVLSIHHHCSSFSFQFQRDTSPLNKNILSYWPTMSCFADWSKRCNVTFIIIECWTCHCRRFDIAVMWWFHIANIEPSRDCNIKPLTVTRQCITVTYPNSSPLTCSVL